MLRPSSLILSRSSTSFKQNIARSWLSTSNDKVDITVFGATGFTGNLIAEYLTAKEHHPDLKIVLAGRNLDKLTALKKRLNEQHGGWPGAEPEIAVAETHDAVSLDGLVKRSKVVLNCSGPFLVLGKPIVESCARLGTDYIDITGETPFSKHVIDNHAQQAQETGSFVVSMCGFDSIPSDLGVYQTVQRIKEQFGESTRRVSTFVVMRGNLSGGTMESFMNMEKDPEMFAQLRNPFLLGGEREGGEIREEDKDVREALNLSNINLPWINSQTECSNAWTGPFMMAEINTRVVRRSDALFSSHGQGYGEEFGYSERMLVPVEKLAQKLAAPLPPIEKRQEMREQGRLPKPGEGPSKEERDKSSFKFFLVGESETGKIVVNSVSGGDPGYSETSKMVSEAALSLVINRAEVNASKLGYKGGVFTPSFTFGDVLIQRLQKAGIAFAHEEQPENVQLFLNSIMTK